MIKQNLKLLNAVFACMVALFLSGIISAQDIEGVIEGKKGGMGWAIGVNTATNRVYAPGCGGFCVIDGEINEVIDTIPEDVFESGYGFITDIEVNSNLNLIYIASQMFELDAVLLFTLDPESKTVVNSVKIRDGRGGIGSKIVLNQTNDQVYIINVDDNKVMFLDQKTWRFAKTIALDGCATFGEAAVNAKNNRVYVTDFCAQAVNVIDGSKRAVVNTITGFDGIKDKGAVFNSKTNSVYIGAEKQIDFATHTFDYWLYVIDANSNQIVDIITMENDTIWTMAANPATNHIFVWYKELPVITVIDAGTNRIIKTLQIDEPPDDIAVNPESGFVYLVDVPHLSTTVINDGSSGPQCVASFVMDNKPDGKLDVLRDFRDNTLANTLTGLGLIKLYYKHSGEVIKILRANPELKSNAEDTIKALTDIIGGINKDSALGDIIDYSIPGWLWNDIGNVLADISKFESNELRDAIEVALKDQK